MTDPTAGNGILVKVHGEDIAAGSQLLPAAGPDQQAELSVVVDAKYLGKVRITYRLGKSPRRHRNLWFWTACHAVVVPSPE